MNAVKLDLVIKKREKVAEDTISLVLARPDGGALPSWNAGAHIELYLRAGVTRQYSLCGDLDDSRSWSIAVLRESSGRGGSKFVHESLYADSRVWVSAPRNHFPLVAAHSYLFIAGGIGITPIMAMMAAADRIGVPWSAVYGGRGRHSMAFLDVLSRKYGDRIDIRPQDEYGLLDLENILRRRNADALVYCCGPESLIKAVEFHASNWQAGTLHVERFRPRGTANSGTNSFKIKLIRSGLVLTVPPLASILDVVEAAGIDAPHSCREGTCGTCETRVLAGAVEHRDSWLTEQERASGLSMMICVSRAAGDHLTLDL